MTLINLRVKMLSFQMFFQCSTSQKHLTTFRAHVVFFQLMKSHFVICKVDFFDEFLWALVALVWFIWVHRRREIWDSPAVFKKIFVRRDFSELKNWRAEQRSRTASALAWAPKRNCPTLSWSPPVGVGLPCDLQCVFNFGFRQFEQVFREQKQFFNPRVLSKVRKMSSIFLGKKI